MRLYLRHWTIRRFISQTVIKLHPRIEEARKICFNSLPNAMTDISDGLLQDLSHILDQSEVSAELELFKVPIHEDVPEEAHRLEKALSDGEDFELLFTISENIEEKLLKDFILPRLARSFKVNLKYL